MRTSKTTGAMEVLEEALKNGDLRSQYECLTRAVHDPQISAEVVQLIGAQVREETDDYSIPWEQLRAASGHDDWLSRFIRVAEQSTNLSPRVWTTFMIAVVLASFWGLVASLTMLGDSISPSQPTSWGTLGAVFCFAVLSLAVMSLIISSPHSSEERKRNQQTTRGILLSGLTLVIAQRVFSYGFALVALALVILVWRNPNMRTELLFDTVLYSFGRGPQAEIEVSQSTLEAQGRLEPSQPLRLRLPAKSSSILVRSLDSSAKIEVRFFNAAKTSIVGEGTNSLEGVYTARDDRSVIAEIRASIPTSVMLKLISPAASPGERRS